MPISYSRMWLGRSAAVAGTWIWMWLAWGAWAGIEYTGLDKVHLAYAGGGPGTFRLELRRDDVPLIDAPGGSFGGRFNDTGLAPGTYTYRVFDHYTPPEPPNANPEVRISVIGTATLIGFEAQGNLLFDETIADAGPLTLKILVDGERTLRLDRVVATGGFLAGTGALALGDVTLGDAIVDLSAKPVLFFGPVRGGTFHLRHPHDIGRLADAQVRFYDGSGLSSFVDCTRLDVTVSDCGADFDDCLGTVLRLETGADVRVHGGSIRGWFCGAGVRAHVVVTQAEVRLVDWSSAAMPYTDRWEADSRVVFDRCQFFNRGKCYLYPAGVEYRDCVFYEGVTVNGRRPRFAGCEFASWVELEDRTDAVFEDSLFHRELVFDRYRGPRNPDGTSPWGNRRWHEADPATPTVRNNSFLGGVGPSYAWTSQEQIAGDVLPPHAAIPIGRNDYGETTGPEIVGPGGTADEFLSGLGAKVTVAGYLGKWQPFFALEPFDPAGRRSENPRVFPSFWLDGWLAGQHALRHRNQNSGLAHSRVQGKETLLSVLIGTSAKEARGVRVRVEFDGQPIDPAPGSLNTVVCGSLGLVSSSAIANGRATFNFVLPPVNKAKAPLQIWLDTTGVEGYPDAPQSGTVTEVVHASLDFDPPVREPLRLLLQPIHLVGVGAPGNAFGFAEKLEDLLTSMLPLRAPQDLEIRIAAAPLPYTPTGGRVWDKLNVSLYPLAASIAAGNKLASLADWWAGTRFEPHFTVALLPAGALGQGVEGLNMKVFRGTLFVTEDKFKATGHELGHAGPGLYTGTEQYQMPEYEATGGKRLEGVTAFVNQPWSALEVQARGRFLHLPKPGYAWKAPVKLLDIMGADEPSWIDPGTLTDFRDWLVGLLGTASAGFTGPSMPVSAPLVEPSYQPPTAPGHGTRRVFLSMRTVKHPASTRHLPDLGTVRLFDTSAFAQRTAGMLREPAFSDYHIAAFDASGQTVFLGGLVIADESSPAQPPPADESSWSATCDLPESAVRLVVRHQKQPDIVYFDHSLSPALSTEIIEPTPGSLVGDTIAVSWSATPSTLPALRSQPLQHLLLVSHDGGATWEPATGQIEGNTVRLSTCGWPSGGGKSLRLLTSDGFRSVEARVENLTLPNRPPRVEIVVPRTADRAVGGHGWALQARVADPDGNQSGAGIWTSSIDGVLGAGLGLDRVVLSTGSHTLTYTAADTSGAMGQASVGVEVAASGGLPIPLADEALTVLRPGEDRYGQPWRPLVAGRPHDARLTLRAPGEEVALRLRLHLAAAGRPETRLSEAIVHVPPFASASTGAEFTPALEGTYAFRATVERALIGGPEIDPEAWTWLPESSRSWSFSTVSRRPITVAPEGQGSVVIAPEGIVCGNTFTGEFDRGRILLLLAVPAVGWRLDGWTGVDAAEQNTGTLIVGEARDVRARFVPGAASSTGSLRVRMRDAVAGAQQMQWRVSGTAEWRVANSVLEGLPAGSYLLEFRNVPGRPEVPLHLLEIAGGSAVVLEYVVPTFTIEVVPRPVGGGEVSGGGDPLPGSSVMLRAEPSTNRLFDGWSEGGLLLTLEEDHSFEAVRHRQIIGHFLRSIPLSSAEDLQKIGMDPAYPADERYHLAGPIDAAATLNWDGGRGFRPIAEFTGYFDGRGHPIAGLHIDRPELENVGLFGQNRGTLSNIVLDAGFVRGNTSVGGLVGYNLGLIENCDIQIEVAGAWYVGGLTGRNRGAAGAVQRSASKGNVTGGSIVGGLVGLHEFGAALADSFATGAAAGAERVGGLVGRVFEASVARCYSIGPVAGTSSIGGLIGSKSFDDAIQASFWDTVTSGLGVSSGGTGRDTAALERRATYQTAGWDFDTVWGIVENEGYPFLLRSWEEPPSPPQPPRILAFDIHAGTPYLILATTPGLRYTLEQSFDLRHWIETATMTATGAETRFGETQLGHWWGQDRVFYRARVSRR